MVSERQKLARKRYKEANPELFPKPEPTPPKYPNKKKKKNKKSAFKKKKGESKDPNNKKLSFKKHPFRVAGMKPGESCFICKEQDHIAKDCPKKAEWEKNKVSFLFIFSCIFLFAFCYYLLFFLVLACVGLFFLEPGANQI